MGCRQLSQTQTTIFSLRSILLWLVLLRIVLATDCFFPNGTQSEDSPCNASGASMCCGPGVACLGNGVCLGGTYINGYWKYTYARGSCTDETWEDSACIRECLDGELSGGWGPLIPCIDDTDEYYCYYQDRDNSGADCGSRDDVFSLSGGNSVVTMIGVAGPTTVTKTTTSTIVSTKTQISTVVSTITRVSTIVVTSFVQTTPTNPNAGGSGSTAAKSGSKTITGNSSEQTSTLTPSSPSTTANTTTMGAAVGSSLGAVIVCMSAYIAYLRRKREQAEKMIPTQPIWQTGQTGLPGTLGPPPLPPPLPPTIMMPNYTIPSAPVPPPPPPPLSPPNYHWSASPG
ncbi:hypothetical protein TWF694_002879 [Orbilia ellipsospora]|uniref:Uncharacterized protein n=1 Tax=Orbilia ellipsospora TaxID=2528407 RepID=A0AAV9X006_9PEZI